VARGSFLSNRKKKEAREPRLFFIFQDLGYKIQSHSPSDVAALKPHQNVNIAVALRYEFPDLVD
jgi:hypothetical protein